MIYISDLSPLMQSTISKDITFIISKSGVPNYYNLYFAKYVDGKGNISVRLTYDESEQNIYQCADENHAIMQFDNIDDVLEYVLKELE